MNRHQITRSIAAIIAVTATFAWKGPASIVMPMAKWDHLAVSVCFASSKQASGSQLSDEMKQWSDFRPKLLNFSTRERQWMKEIIEQEFRPEFTRIHFTGWEDCTSSSPADVWVYLAKGNGSSLGHSSMGQATVLIGNRHLDIPKSDAQKNADAEHRRTCRDSMCKYYGHYIVDKYASAVYEPRPKPAKPASLLMYRPSEDSRFASVETRFKGVAVHEFGHVAGLIHEHERKGPNGQPVAEWDGNCQTAGFKPSMDHVENRHYTGLYDPGSVMSYCYMRMIFNNWGAPTGRQGTHTSPIGLSLGDRHALRCLYSPQGMENEKDCRADYQVR